ncbi:MAG: BamA/TamA family outer membrane protein [Bacteroidales bacterium]
MNIADTYTNNFTVNIQPQMPGIKRSVHRRLLLLAGIAFLVFASKIIFAQPKSIDFKDIVSKWKKNSIPKINAELVVGKGYYSLLPVLGYAPANGFVIGGAISFARLYGKPPTNLSSGMLNFQVTSKQQFIVNARSKIYLDANNWFFQGDWRLLVFTQPTYGLGINNSEFEHTQLYVNNLVQTEETIGEPMKFDQIRFYEEVSHRIGDLRIYAGMGIAIDQHFKIFDERLDTSAGSGNYFVTNHYKYSRQNGFNPDKYGTNGIKFTLLTDTRDNISNSYKGYFASISVLHNIKIANNSQQSTQFLYDARYYLGLNSDAPRHVLAFWSWGSILINGNLPYLALPAIGWDTYNRSGRGYVQGRFRGLSMIYNEAEYRYPISKNGLWGGTVFANATTVSSYNEKLFDNAALGLGAGLRMQLDKLARTNLTVDIGIGTDHSSGIYFNLQETF